MTRQGETGHAKNMANFETLITTVTGYGITYNPSKSALKLLALQTLETNAKTTFDAVKIAFALYHASVAARESAFSPVSKLMTRVLGAVKALDTIQQIDDNVKALVHKIQGTSTKRGSTVATKQTTTTEVSTTKQNSTIQMSFDTRLENLDKLIKLLNGIPLYVPNEEDIKIETLTALYNDLKAKNTAVITSSVALSNARIARDKVFYKDDTGLFDIAVSVKNYVKSVFGASTPQYKQVSRLVFKSY